jgi:hypothetical protein
MHVNPVFFVVHSSKRRHNLSGARVALAKILRVVIWDEVAIGARGRLEPDPGILTDVKAGHVALAAKNSQEVAEVVFGVV